MVDLWLETKAKKKQINVLNCTATVVPHFLHISSSWVEISLHTECQPPRLPRSGRFMVGEQNKKHFHRMNGLGWPKVML